MEGQKNNQDCFRDDTSDNSMMFFEHCPFPAIELDQQNHILNANPATFEIFRFSPHQLKNQSLFNYIIPEEKQKISSCLESEKGEIETSIQTATGRFLPVEMIFRRIKLPETETLLLYFNTDPIRYSDGCKDQNNVSSDSEAIQTLHYKITELENLNQKLENQVNLQNQAIDQIKRNKNKFHSLCEILPEMIFEADKNGKITFVNQKGLEMLGYARKECLKEKTIWQLLLHPMHKKMEHSIESLSQEQAAAYPQEFFIIRKDQVKIPIEIHAVSIKDDEGKLIGIGGIILDVTQRKEYEEKIKYLSFHDKLTNLYNRAYFEEELKRLNSKRNLPISIIIGDVNNLKMTNDTFGHQHGDRLLCEIAHVLQSCFRKGDILSRWGGDEFSVILPHTSKREGEDIINRISMECQKRSTLTLPLSISMGIATKTKASENVYAVVREAESRMYRSKLIDKQVANSTIIDSLEKALEQRNYETRQYRQCFVNCALEFGKTLALEKEKLDDLRLLAMICDVGKIAISEAIILKKGWLSQREWEEIKKHPEIGFRIAKSSSELAHIADAILYHHEFWNGLGYPQGLKGKGIPLLARIIHIVNAYQAMIHKKPYREALKKEIAIKELEKAKGSQFDPELTDKFIKMICCHPK